MVISATIILNAGMRVNLSVSFVMVISVTLIPDAGMRVNLGEFGK